MQIKIVTNDPNISLEFVFETMQQNKSKFSPTTDNKIHVEVEADEEEKYWYFLK